MSVSHESNPDIYTVTLPEYFVPKRSNVGTRSAGISSIGLHPLGEFMWLHVNVFALWRDGMNEFQLVGKFLYHLLINVVGRKGKEYLKTISE